MTASPRLRADGKPMRALRALEAAGRPINETEVYNRARVAEHEIFWSALATLCRHGLAEKTGRRGGYRYAITQVGRDYLRGVDHDA